MKNRNEISNTSFHEITELIREAKQRAYRAVNIELVTLYWQVGETISRRIESDGWGKSTIKSLSSYIRETQPGIRGFSAQNLWRMRQFYEVYSQNEKLSALLRELPWTHHMLLCATKNEEVVEYALSRSLSPAMVAEYQTQMPNKKLLQAKLHEFYQQLAPLDAEDAS